MRTSSSESAVRDVRAGRRYFLAAACACAALGMTACGPGEEPRAAAAAAAATGEAARSAAPTPAAAEDARPVVLFLGTSLTAGYGLPSEQAYPALLQERIDRARLDYRVVNAGVSGDTSAGGLRRLDWLLRLPIAVLVLELGANDMLRGLDVPALRENLTAIVERTRAAHPGARLIVAGMRAAPNLGAAYAARFDSVFPELAQAHDGALVPFLLDGVAGTRALNQADGAHPTAEGQRVVADNVWQVLEPVLRTHRADAGSAKRGA